MANRKTPMEINKLAEETKGGEKPGLAGQSGRPGMATQPKTVKASHSDESDYSDEWGLDDK